jgi:hypothetical protein
MIIVCGYSVRVCIVLVRGFQILLLARMQGSVVDGCIQCPYHGWSYDGGGACTRMPSTAFCRGVSVASLPVAEREGFLWVWPGAQLPRQLAPHAARPPDDFTVRCRQPASARLLAHMRRVLFPSCAILVHETGTHAPYVCSSALPQISIRV